MNLKGICIPHNKNTHEIETVDFGIPQKVFLPLSQHMGAPCESLVKVGDYVFVGQKIADTDAFMSTPLHSSVSGKVTAIKEFMQSNGKVCDCIEIESDLKQEISQEVSPPNISDKESFIKAVRNSGCCGLGGAGFPTHIKLNINQEKTPIDSLVVNGAECEPYITSDYRELIENQDDVLNGVEIILKQLEIKKAYICIEENKPNAIENFTKEVENNPQIEVVTLKSTYPQGAEKVIVYSATGRIIGEGQLPSSVGAVVINVSTVGFISRYIKTGMPLIKRRVTVDGDLIKNPMNINVLIGTPVAEILSIAKCDMKQNTKLISGGMMMGKCLIDMNSPIVKTNNAILAIAKRKEKLIQTNCIKCGSCMKACPLNLMPMVFEKAFDHNDAETLKKHSIMLCMNCGSCSYVCPAKRNLAEKNQMAKVLTSKK